MSGHHHKHQQLHCNDEDVTELFSLYQFIDTENVICLNEMETEILTDKKINSNEDIEKCAKIIQEKGSQNVIITLGSKGFFILDEKGEGNFKDAIEVENVVDTLGVGDCFVGSFAFFIASGIDVLDSLNLANYLASISVQFVGIQNSFPSQEDLIF